jgi:hypothetical protein
MSVMHLSDGTSRLGIELVRWDGDAYLAVVVESRGFAGRNDLHVADQAFRRFCKELLSLQQTLSGEARLTSVAERELELRVAPADRLGHIAVTGSTGYQVHMAHTHKYYWHSIQFGFEVEPSALDSAVRTAWVQEYAA